MKKEILKYLKSYSCDTFKINRLIVSSFLYSNNLIQIKNKLVNSHLILVDDEDYNNLSDFLSIHNKVHFENLIELFEFVISPEDKVVGGAIYTPAQIRDFIAEKSFSDVGFKSTLQICDPACGCSGFLYTVAKELKSRTGFTYKKIFKKNIYGLDIQEYSIQRSKLLLSLLAIYEGQDHTEFKFNLYTGNSLNFSWNENIKNFKGFDLVLGNPPYVSSRNIDEESKALLQNWSVCSTGHPDLYIPFFELGMDILKPNGILGYITMNTFFKSINGRALREYFSGNSFNLSIIDFGGLQVFNSKSTYTCICIIQNKAHNNLKYKKLDSINALSTDSEFVTIQYDLLDDFNGWNLRKFELIRQIVNTGTPFENKYKTRNGIATLKNKIYIFKPTRSDDNYYYLNDGVEYPIEKEICSDIINPNKLIKNSSIRGLKKKIIFPYYYINGHVTLLEEEDFVNEYPFAYDYLNSKRDELATRDKGNGNYENWYAYGRNQSLEKLSHKLFFPHITPITPNFVYNSDENLLFHNGLAVTSDNERELIFIKKIMSSRLFWFYITNSSKPYGSGYFSLSRNYIKRFGVYDFTDEEIDYIINEQDQELLDEFIDLRYDIDSSIIE